jgi:hypothetical protein
LSCLVSICRYPQVSWSPRSASCLVFHESLAPSDEGRIGDRGRLATWSIDTLGSKGLEVPLDLEARGLNFDKAPWFSRFIGDLVTIKLGSVLCQRTRVPWKRWFDVPRFLLRMVLPPVYASIFLESQVVDGGDLPWSPASLVPS